MKKVVNLSQIDKIIREVKATAKTIVLVGGCFDLLHMGHLKFLEAAKKQGDVLIVALESDKNVKRRKGQGRPINNQQTRAENLTSLPMVELVIKLPDLTTNGYQNLVKIVKPDIIAITRGDPKTEIKKQQAKIVGAKARTVIDRLPGLSTTNIIKNL